MIRALAIGWLAALLSFAQVEDAPAQARRAAELLAAGHPEAAMEIYRSLLRAYPASPELLLNLSIAEFQAKRYGDAGQHARAALDRRPDLATADLFLGASYLKLGQPAEALEPLRQAAQAMPADRNARLMWAEALLGVGRYAEALPPFRAIADQMPDNPRVWYGLGQTYDGLAAALSSRLETTAPHSAYWLVLAGDAYCRQRRFGSAFSSYREAIVAGPPLPGIHAGLAQVYRHTGHADWAALETSAEQQTAPLTAGSTGPALDYRAYRSNSELAAAAYGRLAQLPPSLESILHRAGKLESEGSYRAASLEWRAACNREPENDGLRIRLAKSLYQSDDYESAIPVLREVLASTGDSAEMNFLCGSSLLHLERAKEAEPYLERALLKDPRLLAAHAALGLALLRQGKPDQAIPHLKLAAERSDDTNSLFQLFRAYQLTGVGQLAQQTLAAFEQRRSSLEAQRRLEDGALVTAPRS